MLNHQNSVNVTNQVDERLTLPERVVCSILCVLTLVLIVLCFVFNTFIFYSWISGNGGSNAYYAIKSQILPAKVECQVKKINEGYVDLLVINQETNEGILYKGFRDPYEMHDTILNLPKGWSYQLYSNYKVPVFHDHYKESVEAYLKDGTLLSTSTYLYLRENRNLADTPSEWKEYLSVNMIPNKSIADYVLHNPKTFLFSYSYMAE